MKRYAICKIIGDGQLPETAYRAAIQDVVDPNTGMKAFSVSAVIASNPDGTPKYPWCLVVATGTRFDALNGNPDVDLLPDVPLDVKVASMHVPTKVLMAQKLQNRGIDTAFIGNADGFREIVRGLGRKHDVTFSEDAFDVSE